MAERELGVTRLLDPEGKLDHFLRLSNFLIQPVRFLAQIYLACRNKLNDYREYNMSSSLVTNSIYVIYLIVKMNVSCSIYL